MTVQEASKIIHVMIDRQHVNYTLDQMRALCISLSVLDTLPPEQAYLVNCIWNGKPYNLSMRIGDS